jgi:hypothetical protein
LSYYFSFKFRGQRYTRCLETNDAKLAAQAASAKWKEIRAGIVRDDVKAVRDTKTRHESSATLGEFLKAFDDCPSDAGAGLLFSRGRHNVGKAESGNSSWGEYPNRGLGFEIREYRYARTGGHPASRRQRERHSTYAKGLQ